MVTEKFGVSVTLGPKKFGSEKNVGYEINFWPKKIVAPKKCLAPDRILSMKKSWVQKCLWVWIKSLIQKICSGGGFSQF